MGHDQPKKCACRKVPDLLKMKKWWSQPLFYFPAITLVVVAMIYVFKKESAAQRGISEAPSGIIISPTLTETVPPNPSVAGGASSQPSTVFSSADWDVVVRCVSRTDFKKYFAHGTLDVAQWLREDEQVRQTVDQILIHYKNAGESLRLRVFPSSSHAPETEGKEPAQLFKVDTDGLPTAIEMPMKWKNMSENNILSFIRNTYPVSQTIENGRLEIPERMFLEYTMENQQITQFQMQWVSSGKSAFVACDQAAQKVKCICP